MAFALRASMDGFKDPQHGVSNMFHLAAFFQSNTAAVLASQTPVTDGIIPIANGHFLPYMDYDLISAYVSSATLTRARLNSGTIRQINPVYIRPINIGLLPANNTNMMMIKDEPFRVHGQEELALELSATGGPENSYGLIWLQRQYESPPAGPIYNIRFTGTTAAAANVWSPEPYTLETALPAGVYTVVGGECQSTTGIAFRLTFDNQVERPGTLMAASLGSRQLYDTYYGGLGKWGSFKSYSNPRLEVLCNAADAAFEGYLQVLRTGNIS